MQLQQAAPKHAGATFFHAFFKVLAVLWYFLCELINSKSFVTNFVISIILLALDFWTVKNVTGRLLVGLRWWNEANEGGSAWRFETLTEGQRAIDGKEKRWFWIVMVANVVVWGVLALAAFIGLKWEYLMIPIVAIIMGSSNLIGYYHCSKDAKSQLQSMSANVMASAFQSRLTSAISRV